MTIIDINEYKKKLNSEQKKPLELDSKAFYSKFEKLKNKTSSSGIKTKVSTKLFFIFLMSLNAVWFGLAFFSVLILLFLNLITFFSLDRLKKILDKVYISLKRSSVCFIALLVAIFNPALGIMFSCLYFMTYDKMGIEEIIPSSLKEQFKEFFPG